MSLDSRRTGAFIYGYTPRGPWRKREEKDGIVYLVMCIHDLKVFIGQTDDVDRRLCEHLGGYGGAEGLANAIKKHHRNNFVCMILLAGLPKEALDSAEIAVIRHLDCLASSGYNIQPGGGRSLPPLPPIPPILKLKVVN